MSKYKVNLHEVEAQRIVKLLPVAGRNGMGLVSPDQMLTMVLDDGRRIQWMAGVERVPDVNDLYVVDRELGTSYTVAAAKFENLFSQQEG